MTRLSLLLAGLAPAILALSGCQDSSVSPQHPGPISVRKTAAQPQEPAAAKSSPGFVVDEGLELRAQPVEKDPRGRPVLVFRLTNVGDAAMAVPNGERVNGYGDRRSGLRLEIRDSAGRQCHPDPGAGGPAMMIEPKHFTTLQPRESLTVRVGLARYMVPPPIESDRPADRLTMSRIGDAPGRFTAKVRWTAEELRRLDAGLVRRGAETRTAPLEPPTDRQTPDPARAQRSDRGEENADDSREANRTSKSKKSAGPAKTIAASRWSGKTDPLELEFAVE